jgi:hypothetical protein
VGSKCANGASEVWPEGSFISGSFALTSEAEGLAGPAARDDIDGLNSGPIDRGDVTEVGLPWPVVLVDLYRAQIDVRPPDRLRAKEGFGSYIQAAIASE